MKNNNRNDKIKSLVELNKTVLVLKSQKKQIVQCHGVFDIVHPGHIRHLDMAKREGDVLVVTVTPDEYVNKGPGRPVFNQHLRAESLAALQSVDYVAINDWPTGAQAIHFLKPDVYALADKSTSREDDLSDEVTGEEQAVLSEGGRVYRTGQIAFSSSHLINAHFHVFPPETEEWLKVFREQHSTDEIIRYLEGAAPIKALVVGEAIIDEYVFCDMIGKSTKDPILAAQYKSTETFAGGSLAIANHLAGFCDQVGLITSLGEKERREDDIRNMLHSNVNSIFLSKKDAPTIHKRRFVDRVTQNKLLELYIMDDRPLNEDDEISLMEALDETIDDYDLVIAADYGHGILTKSVIAALCDGNHFLAVNTQSNAGNRGFNPISKYKSASYVCLAAHEIAIETRMREGNPRDLLLEVAKRIDCPRFTVTRGKDGSQHYEIGRGFTDVPALATHVTDRVGAGDAVLAITSLLLVQNAPWEIVGFVGNVAGGQMVANLGNRLSIDKKTMAKSIISLMK